MLAIESCMGIGRREACGFLTVYRNTGHGFPAGMGLIYVGIVWEHY